MGKKRQTFPFGRTVRRDLENFRRTSLVRNPGSSSAPRTLKFFRKIRFFSKNSFFSNN
jgi:hypothetical protein